MDQPTYISFVRHGHVHNPSKVYYGRLEGFSLSDEGTKQAQIVAHYFSQKPVAQIYSSPLLRARQTAAPIAERHAERDVRVSDHLIEVHTPFDSLPHGVLEDRNWDLYTGVGPEYEQAEDVLRRGLRFVAEIRQQQRYQLTVAVTHGDVVALLTLWARQMREYQGQKQLSLATGQMETYPAVASVTTFIYRTNLPDEAPEFDYIIPH